MDLIIHCEIRASRFEIGDSRFDIRDSMLFRK
jgi:hypothetical protein